MQSTFVLHIAHIFHSTSQFGVSQVVICIKMEPDILLILIYTSMSNIFTSEIWS